ncbi:MAG: YgfZ/GcvT domain-containing protein [Beijerinckiaceae bacterium]
MTSAFLPDRGVLRIAGHDARNFLQNVLTGDMAHVSPDRAAFAALLSPQGKILCDGLIIEAAPDDGGGFLVDCPLALADDVLQALTRYRLRAKVTLENLSHDAAVVAVWHDGHVPDGVVFEDPRLSALGVRVLMDRAEAAQYPDTERYLAHRVMLGVPEGGKDFTYGDAFPHEADMDQLNGIDFKKGCYIGQEVVSRMAHRASGGRTRIVPVRYEGGFAPVEGSQVFAGDRSIGATGSQAHGHGLMTLRLDKYEAAVLAGERILAGGIGFELIKPEWARFRFPGEAESGTVTGS